MDDSTLIYLGIILFILNIPVYLFLGWIVFDTGAQAADTVFETVVTILKIIFIPRLVRVLLEMDDDGAVGLFPIAAFLIACVAITGAEMYLIQTYILQA